MAVKPVTQKKSHGNYWHLKCIIYLFTYSFWSTLLRNELTNYTEQSP
jgi:hypothetical protein